MSSASTFANKVVSVLQEIQQDKKVSFELFFTGHSLGFGWHTFTAEYLEEKGGTFLMKLKRETDGRIRSSTVQDSQDVTEGWLALITDFITKFITGTTFLMKLEREEHEPPTSSTVQDSRDVRQSYHPHTVVFDSPGCKDMLSQMADKLDVRLHGGAIDLQHLDITSYLCAPSRINTCNKHLGTVHRIFIDLSDMGWLEKHTALYNLATHSMSSHNKAICVFQVLCYIQHC